MLTDFLPGIKEGMLPKPVLKKAAIIKTTLKPAGNCEVDFNPAGSDGHLDPFSRILPGRLVDEIED